MVSRHFEFTSRKKFVRPIRHRIYVIGVLYVIDRLLGPLLHPKKIVMIKFNTFHIGLEYVEHRAVGFFGTIESFSYLTVAGL